ncbi:hypothetical protein [Deinococcus koreensis]|uniref:Tetratricopeptide repeat protein n=1 Tax=Deinococcus koreensis TaxID=2054903 RepID=A0A2K3URN1_9DEIO|nr:hypothetical protein [Deinococcus koreensis]PNY79177.1 hypothetical protein CVO96_20470 [Deinococcus koreensis]
MDPVSTALNLAFNFAGRKLLEAGYKKLTTASVSDEEYALLTALTTLHDGRQAAGRLALQDWLASPEWRSGAVLEGLKQGSGVTPALLGLFEDREHGLEARDRPRVVAETFLAAYWILYLRGQGHQVLLDQGRVTQEVLRDMQRSVGDMAAMVQQLHAQLVPGGESAARVPLPGTPLSPTDPHAPKLERIDHSLEDFALAAAGRRLRALEGEVDQMSDAARAKYLRLWGNLENNLGHRDEAARRYVAAFEYDSTSPGGLTLRGYAALLDGEPEKALGYLNRALGKQRRSDTLALKVYALDELGRHGEIEALRAQEGAPGNLELSLALAQTAMQQERFDVASADLRPLLATEHAQDPRLHLALARVKMKPLELELRGAPRAITEVPALLEGRPEIAEALNLVDGVLAEPGGLAPPLLNQASNLKQAILFWHNRFPELLEVAQAALKTDPDDVASLRHAALAQMALDRPEDAWQTFTRISEGERDVEVRMLGASAAERTGRAPEATELLTGILQEDLDPRARDNALLMATRVLLAQNRAPAARVLLDGEADDRALVWLARAEVAEALDDHQAAPAAYRRAVALAQGERVVGLSVQLAQYLRVRGQLDEAAEVVTAVVEQTQDAELLHWMGPLLLQAGAFPAAQMVVDALDAQQDVSFETHALSAALHASLEQWDAAAERQVRLLELRPDDAHELWNAAVVRRKQDQPEEVLNLLRRYVARPDVSAAELMNAADVASQLAPGREALGWAYEARRRSHSDPGVHSRYFQIALRCPHEHNLPEVQPESAVLLANDDTQRWLVLTGDGAPAPERGEFALDSREAQVLLGQRLGSTVKLREGEGGTFEVRGIITKFANAERSFLQDFHQLFPADNSMVRLRVLDPSPEFETGLPEEWRNLRAAAEKTARQRDEARQIIARNRYAHVLNATLATESATAFWLGVFRRPETYLSFLGEEADAQAASVALGAPAWVVDVSALLGLAMTDQLELLLLAGIPLQVTTQTEAQLEMLAPQQEPVARALHFVRTHTAVVVAPPAIGALGHLFPEEAASAMALAAAQALPLLTEDAGLRHSNREGTLGPVLTAFGVVDALLAVYRAGTLNQTALETHLLPLLLAGRLFLPLSSGLLQHVIAHDSGQVGPGLQALLRLLLHPNITVQYQAVMAGELLKLLWAQPDLSGRRQAVVRQLVGGLGEVVDRTQRFRELYRVVQHLFRLMPQQAREVTAELQKAQATWPQR